MTSLGRQIKDVKLIHVIDITHLSGWSWSGLGRLVPLRIIRRGSIVILPAVTILCISNFIMIYIMIIFCARGTNRSGGDTLSFKLDSILVFV